VRLDHGEPRVFDDAGKRVYRPEIGRGHGMIEWLERGSLEEPDHEPTTWRQAAGELREGCTDLLGLGMDERVPGKDAAQTRVVHAEILGSSQPERRTAVAADGFVDESRYRIDALDVGAQFS
jgi:hypothetical protein